MSPPGGFGENKIKRRSWLQNHAVNDFFFQKALPWQGTFVPSQISSSPCSRLVWCKMEVMVSTSQVTTIIKKRLMVTRFTQVLPVRKLDAPRMGSLLVGGKNRDEEGRSTLCTHQCARRDDVRDHKCHCGCTVSMQTHRNPHFPRIHLPQTHEKTQRHFSLWPVLAPRLSLSIQCPAITLGGFQVLGRTHPLLGLSSRAGYW